MDSDTTSRLATELSLLESMYPDQITFSPQTQQLDYKTSDALLQLRIPPAYPGTTLPDILSARSGRTDLRDSVKERILQCETGEEVLDSIILAFNHLVEAAAEAEISNRVPPTDLASVASDDSSKTTTIIWLHHLLALSKRKQALSPPSPSVSGVTKPGYPGVLIFSGPAKHVLEHVNSLKQLNWQAFQVRLEIDDEWSFTHGKGMVEVEAMGDVVHEIGEDKKHLFMESMRMK